MVYSFRLMDITKLIYWNHFWITCLSFQFISYPIYQFSLRLEYTGKYLIIYLVYTTKRLSTRAFTSLRINFMNKCCDTIKKKKKGKIKNPSETIPEVKWWTGSAPQCQQETLTPSWQAKLPFNHLTSQNFPKLVIIAL